MYSSAGFSRGSLGAFTQHMPHHWRPAVTSLPSSARAGSKPEGREGNRRLTPAGKSFTSRVTKPLSELESVAHVPLFNIGAWANRPIELRRLESTAVHVGRDNKIKRPNNAFFLYRKAYHDRAIAVFRQLVGKRPAEHHLSVLLGHSWRMETLAVRELFFGFADEDALRHREAFPDYVYSKPKMPPCLQPLDSASFSTPGSPIQVGSSYQEAEASGKNLHDSMYIQYLEWELANSKREIKELMHRVNTLQKKLATAATAPESPSQVLPAGFDFNSPIDLQPCTNVQQPAAYDPSLSEQVGVDELMPSWDHPVDLQIFSPDETVYSLDMNLVGFGSKAPTTDTDVFLGFDDSFVNPGMQAPTAETDILSAVENTRDTAGVKALTAETDVFSPSEDPFGTVGTYTDFSDLLNFDDAAMDGIWEPLTEDSEFAE